MRASKWPYLLAGACALIFAALSWRSQQAALELAQQIEQVRVPAGEAVRLRKSNQDLVRIQLTPAEVEQRRAARETIERLRVEIEGLRKAVEALARVPNSLEANPGRYNGINLNDPKVAATLAETAVAELEWTNRGRDVPGAALETMIWAARNGDIDTMASMIVLEGPVREKAEALLAGLSGSLRAQYDTPEKLIALYTVRDAPVALLLVGASGGAASRRLLVNLQNPRGGLKEVEIALRRDPDGWRLVVPLSAVEGYAALVGNMPSPP